MELNWFGGIYKDERNFFANFAVEGLTVLENIDLGGCRRHALGRDRAADECIDEGTLA